MHLPPEAAAGKVKRGGTAVWVDRRRKGVAGAAAIDAADAVADTQSGITSNSNSKSNHNGSCDTCNNNGKNDTNKPITGERAEHNIDDGDKDGGGDGDNLQTPGMPTGASVHHDVSRTSRNNSPAPLQSSRGSSSPALPVTSTPAPAPAGGSSTTAAEFATAALVRATACQRRGRAQKKRARKVKDKMRQLCLEVSTTTPTGTGAAEVAPWPRLERAAKALGELALAKAQLAISKAALPAAVPNSAGPAEIRGGVRGLATASADDTSHFPTDARPSGVEPRPPLPTSSVTDHPGIAAASDDGTAATAKGVGREAAFAVGKAKKSRAAVLIAEDTQEGSSSGDGERSYSSSGADQLSSSAGQSPTHRKTRRGKRAGGAINRRRRAKEISGSKRSATAAAARAREGRITSHTDTASASEGGVVDIQDVVAKGDAGAVGGGRKGRGARGNVDTKVTPIAATPVADAVSDAPPPPQADGKRKSHRETPKIKNGQEVEPQGPQLEQHRTAASVGLSSVDIGRGEREDRGVSLERGAEGCGAVIDRRSKNGHVFDGADRRRGGSAAAAGAAAAGVAACGASGRSGSSLSSSSSSSLPSLSPLAQDVAALEGAAWRSLRDLQAMCPSSPCYSASASAPAAVVPGCSQQSSPPRSPSACSNGSGTAGATEKTNSTANASHRLRRQLRARGVLDSLVAICAPFPWTPVDPPLGATSAVKEGGVLRGCADSGSGDSSGVAVATTSSANPAGAAALAGDTMRKADSTGVGTLSADSASDQSGGCNPGVQRAGSLNCEHDRQQHHHYQGVSQAAMATVPLACNRRGEEENWRNVRAKKNGVGSSGDCRGGGREAMTESALAVLLAVLVEEPSNRAYVLKMDGGAPLVSR